MQDDDLALLRRKAQQGDIPYFSLAEREKRAGLIPIDSIDKALEQKTPMRQILKTFPMYARTLSEQYLSHMVENSTPDWFVPRSSHSASAVINEAYAFARPSEFERITAGARVPYPACHHLGFLALAYDSTDPERAQALIEQISTHGRTHWYGAYAAHAASRDLPFAVNYINKKIKSPTFKRTAHQKLLCATVRDNPNHAKEQSKRAGKSLQFALASRVSMNPELALSFIRYELNDRDYGDLCRTSNKDLSIAIQYFKRITSVHAQNHTLASDIHATRREHGLLLQGQVPTESPTPDDFDFVANCIRANASFYNHRHSPFGWFQRHPESVLDVIARAEREHVRPKVINTIIKINVPNLIITGRRKDAETLAATVQNIDGELERVRTYANMILTLYDRPVTYER